MTMAATTAREKISLVIPNLNYGEYLEACLSSVAAQSHRELEVILIDGGSIDHSQQVFQTFAAQYGWKFFVRPNESQAAAIAWGLAHTTGEVQGWLNSDDLFLTARALKSVLVPVSAQGSASERNCASASTMRLMMAKRSKVDRASRSIRVTATTSPAARSFSIL